MSFEKSLVEQFQDRIADLEAENTILREGLRRIQYKGHNSQRWMVCLGCGVGETYFGQNDNQILVPCKSGCWLAALLKED